MKRLIILISITSGLIAIITAYLILSAKPKEAEPASNVVHVYSDGAARIDVDNINHVIQLHTEKELDGMTLKKGTLIIPGDGTEIFYNYPRHDSVITRA